MRICITTSDDSDLRLDVERLKNAQLQTQLDLNDLRSTLMSAVSDLAAEFDSATNAIATKLADLQSKLESGVPVAEVSAAFAPILDHLRALGADPAEPVPAPPAELDPADGTATADPDEF